MDLHRLLRNRTLNLLLGYFVISLLAIAVDLLIYASMLASGFYYLVAAGIAYSSGKLVVFFLNKKYNFKDDQKMGKQFPIFVSIASFGLVLTQLLMWISVDLLHGGYIVSRLIVLLIVGINNFTLHNKYTFKDRESFFLIPRTKKMTVEQLRKRRKLIEKRGF